MLITAITQLLPIVVIIPFVHIFVAMSCKCGNTPQRRIEYVFRRVLAESATHRQLTIRITPYLNHYYVLFFLRFPFSSWSKNKATVRTGRKEMWIPLFRHLKCVSRWFRRKADIELLHQMPLYELLTKVSFSRFFYFRESNVEKSPFNHKPISPTWKHWCPRRNRGTLILIRVLNRLNSGFLKNGKNFLSSFLDCIL